jgi:acyl-CoA hydrolase
VDETVSGSGTGQRPERAAETVELSEVVFPTDTNQYGNLFGGHLVALMDKAAFFAAGRFSACNTVTASMEGIDFHTPIREGDIVTLCARVVYTGTSSMIVRVEVYSQEHFAAPRVHNTTGYLTMVAIDAEGRPTPVPRLRLADDADRAAWERAEAIRLAALDRRAREQAAR